MMDFRALEPAAATESVVVVGARMAEGWSPALRRAGLNLIESETGVDLQRIAASQQIKLVIVRVPEEGRLDSAYLDDLRARGHRPLVLLVTTDFSAKNVVNLAEVGDMVLPAPLSADVLLNAVGLLLGRRDDVARFACKYRLSPRETDLLRQAVLGLNNDEAAFALGCSRGTVSTFWHRIFKKTGVSGQRDVIILLLRATYGNSSQRTYDRINTSAK
jgi:DNA-binding NarL/FixJ family response regulator